MIKVSIIIPVYNVEKYIHKCLETIIQQQFNDMEIIVINDGSTDNSLNIINKFAKIDKRIVVINKENEGVSVARNIGIDVSQGEYVMFIDSDDWIEEGAIEIIYTSAIENKADIVYFDFYNVVDQKMFLYNVHKEDDYLSGVLSNKINAAIWNKMFKRSLFENIRFSSEISYGEDLLVHVALAINATSTFKIKGAYYYYLKRKSSITNIRDKRIMSIKNSIYEIKRLLNNHGIYEKYSEEFEYLCYLHLTFYHLILSTKLTKTSIELFRYNTKIVCDVNEIEKNKYYKLLMQEKSTKMKIKEYILRHFFTIFLKK